MGDEDKLRKSKKKWEEETKSHREKVTEDNVAEVVAMMTGVPMQRIAQKALREEESKKLDFTAAQGESLPFAKETFSQAIFSWSL